jgi:hypothetical protein
MDVPTVTENLNLAVNLHHRDYVEAHFIRLAYSEGLMTVIGAGRVTRAELDDAPGDMLGRTDDFHSAQKERVLERHPRVHFHFTSTSASWLNMVEIWFSILTKQQVRRGVYHDVPELIAAIEYFIDGYNERAQPFVWTKTPEQVLAKAVQKQDTSETLH